VGAASSREKKSRGAYSYHGIIASGSRSHHQIAKIIIKFILKPKKFHFRLNWPFFSRVAGLIRRKT